MKYSGIGGQAVMEGVMMRNGRKYAVAVRKPDHQIEVKKEDNKASLFDEKWNKVPMVRGVLSFIDSLVLGMSTLMYSASFFEDEEEEEKEGKKRERREKKQKRSASADGGEKEKSAGETALMGGIVAFSIVIAVAVFMILPYYLSQVFQQFVTDNANLVAIFEGVLRLVIFIGYIVLISRMKDIQRVFMYHGAEHKCINCIEHGLELNVENVRASSKQHKRCGTSFLFFVMIVSIIFCFFITAESQLLRVLLRIALLPLIAGVSYEIIRLAGNSDNPVINALSRPGLWVQNMTTKEPDDSMIEVGIRAVEEVFDWRTWQKENL